MKYKLREMKWFLQSLFKGYSDCDLWNMDYFILKKVRPAFKAYAKSAGKGSCPSFICYTKTRELTVKEGGEKWSKIIKGVEEAMDLIWWDFNGDARYYSHIEKYGTEKTYRKMQRGMRNFGKYFGNFWT